MLELNKCALDLILVLLSITSLLEWKSDLCELLVGSSSCTSLDRSGVTNLIGLVRPVLLRTAVNHVPLFLASIAHFVF